jgi:predicted phosphodiesterase
MADGHERMRKLLRRLLALAGLVMVLPAAGCWPRSGRAPVISCGPYLHHPGRTEMTVAWTSDLSAEGVVRWGPAGGKALQELRIRPTEFSYAKPKPPAPPGAPPAPAETAKAYLYAARLDGLAPGADYEYVVKFEGRKAKGGFRTFPEKPEPFTFLAFSDTHRADAVAAGFAAHRPAFLLNSGDLVDAEFYDQYRQFFSPAVKAATANLPMFVARGNHDQSGRILARLFALPPERLYYSFDYANAHFVCLDSCLWRDEVNGEARIKTMLEWCEADLKASKADWKIAFFHEPPYDMSYRRSDTEFGRLRAMPVFRRSGVDLVFSGHAHSYQRFGPLFTPGENDRHPITTVVSAGASSKYPTLPPPAEPHLVVSSDKSNYVVCRVDGPKLSLRALTAKGRELDSLTITKRDGLPDAAYLASAVPEEPFGSIALSLTDLYLSKAPLSAGEEFSIELELASIAEAYDFEIRPSADSADVAELAAPAKGTVPAKGKTAVTVQLRAKVVIQKQEKGNRAEPELSLECRYQAGGRGGVVTSDLLRVKKGHAAPAPPAAPETK